MTFKVVLPWALMSISGSGLYAQEVFAAGTAKAVMTGADISVHADLDSLLKFPGLIALGPLENLRGEITVLDGIPFVSTAENGGIDTFENREARAPFLAYAYVEQWERTTVLVDLDGSESIEVLIDSMARAFGIDADTPFPFLLNAPWQEVEYHVIMRDTTAESHSHEAHKQAKVKFSEKDIEADLVGFFSRNHEGVFTHKGQFVHIHLLTSDRKRSGHLDGIRHRGEITVSLPELKE